MELYVDNFDRISNITNEKVKALFKSPRGHWYCNRYRNLTKSVKRFIQRTGDATPVLVLYYIPNRDLGSHSAGGAKSAFDYICFINEFCEGLGDKQAIIIFEPDALAHAIASCDEELLNHRIFLINSALKLIDRKCPSATVYIDVGHPRWISAELIVSAIQRIKNFHGVSINVSNFVPLDECIRYGNAIGEHFVIDTSRNGNPNLQESDGWCNPPKRQIGKLPRIFMDGLLDALLWIKVPGESDGKCNGGPKAGKFWLEYGLGLISDEH